MKWQPRAGQHAPYSNPPSAPTLAVHAKLDFGIDPVLLGRPLGATTLQPTEVGALGDLLGRDCSLPSVVNGALQIGERFFARDDHGLLSGCSRFCGSYLCGPGCAITGGLR